MNECYIELEDFNWVCASKQNKELYLEGCVCVFVIDNFLSVLIVGLNFSTGQIGLH